jgi:hypothetical protein
MTSVGLLSRRPEGEENKFVIERGKEESESKSLATYFMQSNEFLLNILQQGYTLYQPFLIVLTMNLPFNLFLIERNSKQ